MPPSGTDCTLYAHSVQMPNQKPIPQPILQIDLNSPVAIYRQIADSLRTSLVEGEFLPGEPLPSVRRLAIELGITLNTVAQAYRLLAEEGWLDLQHGKRVIVVDRRLPSRTSRNTVVGFRKRTRELIAQMRAEGLSPKSIATELRLAAARLEP